MADEAGQEPPPTWRRLEKRYVRMSRQAALVRTLVLVVIAVAVGTFGWWLLEWSTPMTTRIGLVAAVALIGHTVLGLVLPAIRYRHSAWRLGESGLELRRGALWRNETRIPLSRIQHTDVRQGPLERRHGLATIAVFTAGTHFNAIELDGIAHQDAITLRDELIGAGASSI